MTIAAHTNNNPGIATGVWTIDPAHSTVGFSVRHLMVSKVRGRFGAFTGTITIADNALESGLDASVEMTSVDTGDAGRDGDLRGADFLDVETFPTVTFASTSLKAVGGNYALAGNLTIKGVTKPVTFALEFDGVATDPWGNIKAGFSATAEINRKDWGTEWNAVLEAGGVLVGEKVKIQLDIEAAKA